MKILVTGGVGFIGAHLSFTLARAGHTLTILDNFSDLPTPVEQKRAAASKLLGTFAGKISIVEAEVTDRRAVEDAMSGVDAVIHLAALAGVRPSFEDPEIYARVNVEGTACVVKSALRAGVTRIVIASSSSVYGNETPLPALEDAVVGVPESPYAASKRASELMAASLIAGRTDVSCSALRFFTVYGPYQRPEMAITKFLRLASRGDELPLYGDGSSRRDYTHVDDVVRGIRAALERAPMGFRAYNIGCGSPILLSDLVAGISDVVGGTVRTCDHGKQRGDVDATFAETSRARSELGFAPSVPFREGLRSVHDWLLKHA